MDMKNYYMTDILPHTPRLNLIDSIKADLKLQKKIRNYAKQYKRAYPKMSIRQCIEKGEQLAYAELVVIEGTPLVLNAIVKD